MQLDQALQRAQMLRGVPLTYNENSPPPLQGQVNGSCPLGWLQQDVELQRAEVPRESDFIFTEDCSKFCARGGRRWTWCCSRRRCCACTRRCAWPASFRAALSAARACAGAHLVSLGCTRFALLMAASFGTPDRRAGGRSKSRKRGRLLKYAQSQARFQRTGGRRAVLDSTCTELVGRAALPACP